MIKIKLPPKYAKYQKDAEYIKARLEEFGEEYNDLTIYIDIDYQLPTIHNMKPIYWGILRNGEFIKVTTLSKDNMVYFTPPEKVVQNYIRSMNSPYDSEDMDVELGFGNGSSTQFDSLYKAMKPLVKRFFKNGPASATITNVPIGANFDLAKFIVPEDNE